MDRLRRHTKKVLVGIVGGVVALVGLVLVPYPGPGWLIVFAGLAILSTEFEFAQKVLDYAKGKYDAWVEWLKRQPLPIRAVVIALTGLVVLATMWLLNVFGLVGDFLGLPWSWYRSPFFA